MTDQAGFALLGEPLSLDLVNTRVRRDAGTVDLIGTPPALTAWLTAQACRLPVPATVTYAQVRAVCALREAITDLLTAHQFRSIPPGRALATVNAALRTPATAPRLAWAAAGPRLRTQRAAQPAEVLRALALDVATLLTGPDADLVRTCEHPDCVLRFLARNRNRRWCSATNCGNRARVARHYARHHARPHPGQ
jgi:predicted RNA-binding Zn ribbon-like protein